MVYFRELVILLILFFAIGLSSCTKGVPSQNSGKRLVQIVPSGADSIGIIWLTYGNQNRLTHLKDSSTHSKGFWNADLNYDNQGRMQKIAYTDESNNQWFDTFSYNNMNEIIEQDYLLQDGTLVERRKYYYDNKNRLILDSFYYYQVSIADGYKAYTYDNNDNLVNTLIYSNHSTQWVLEERTDYLSYDNHLNVYNGLKFQYLFEWENEFYLSRNNVVSYSTKDFNVYAGNSNIDLLLNYSYDSNSLPTDVTVVANNNYFNGRHFVYDK